MLDQTLLTCCWVLSHAHEFSNIRICRGRRGNRPWSNFAHESLCMHCGYFQNLFFAVNIFTISSSTGIPDCATSQVQWLPPWPLAPPLIASVASPSVEVSPLQVSKCHFSLCRSVTSPSVASPSVAFPSVEVSPFQTVTDKSSHCHRRRVLTDKYLGRQMLTLCVTRRLQRWGSKRLGNVFRGETRTSVSDFKVCVATVKHNWRYSLTLPFSLQCLLRSGSEQGTEGHSLGEASYKERGFW